MRFPNWLCLKRKKKYERKLAVLVDYMNIDLMDGAANAGKTLDFKKLREECLKIGVIEEALVFIPEHWVDNLPRISYLGFEIIVCQGIKNGSDKIEDRVDIHIIKKGWKLLKNFSSITDFVLVGHDGHMLEWVKDAQLQGKDIHIFSGEKLNFFLKEVVSKERLYPVPLSDKYT